MQAYSEYGFKNKTKQEFWLGSKPSFFRAQVNLYLLEIRKKLSQVIPLPPTAGYGHWSLEIGYWARWTLSLNQNGKSYAPNFCSQMIYGHFNSTRETHTKYFLLILTNSEMLMQSPKTCLGTSGSCMDSASPTIWPNQNKELFLCQIT